MAESRFRRGLYKPRLGEGKIALLERGWTAVHEDHVWTWPNESGYCFDFIRALRNMQQHEEEKYILTELDKQFPDENKGYDNRSLKKKEQEEILSNFNAGNPNGIKQGLKTILGNCRFLRSFQAWFRGNFKSRKLLAIQITA